MVPDITRNEINQRQLVKWQLVRPCNVVVVIGDLTRIEQVGNDRVTIDLVLIRFAAIDDTSRLTNKRLSGSIVIKLQRLRQVIFQRIVPIPLPRFHHLRIDQQVRFDTKKCCGVVPHTTCFVNPVHL